MDRKQFPIKKTFPIKFKGTGFPHKVLDHSSLKILTPKQMLQRLSTVLAKVKMGNTSENWLNKIQQIVYYLYWSKEISKKVYSNIINSIKA